MVIIISQYIHILNHQIIYLYSVVYQLYLNKAEKIPAKKMLLCLAGPVDNFLGLQRLTWMVRGVNLKCYCSE